MYMTICTVYYMVCDIDLYWPWSNKTILHVNTLKYIMVWKTDIT